MLQAKQTRRKQAGMVCQPCRPFLTNERQNKMGREPYIYISRVSTAATCQEQRRNKQRPKTPLMFASANLAVQECKKVLPFLSPFQVRTLQASMSLLAVPISGSRPAVVLCCCSNGSGKNILGNPFFLRLGTFLTPFFHSFCRPNLDHLSPSCCPLWARAKLVSKKSMSLGSPS